MHRCPYIHLSPSNYLLDYLSGCVFNVVCVCHAHMCMTSRVGLTDGETAGLQSNFTSESH